MKTTLELPDALIKEVKLRALHEGQKLKDAVAELLRRGLAVEVDASVRSAAPEIKKDKKTRLPLVMCKHAAAANQSLTPERVADLLLNQEVESFNGIGR